MIIKKANANVCLFVYQICNFLLLIGLIASFAVRAFKHIFRFANRNHRQNKKQRDVIPAAFPDELPEKAAAVAAMLLGGFIRAGNVEFCAGN